MPTKTVKKRSTKKHRTRRDIAADALLKAAARWVNAAGGKALVAGGIEVQHWPGDREFTFRLGIRITGRPPVKEENRAD